eukprot:Tbor_TRINITY_DN5367_c5_g3::TRINITY_DN5367_c5_g3_i1::g.3814::m.3814
MSSFSSPSPQGISYPMHNWNNGHPQGDPQTLAPPQNFPLDGTGRSHPISPIATSQTLSQNYPIPPRGVTFPQQQGLAQLPVDEYICGVPPPNASEDYNPCNPFDTIADCGTILTGFLTVVSFIGLIVVLVVNDADKITNIYPNLASTGDLQKKMESDIVVIKEAGGKPICNALNEAFIGTWGLRLCVEQALTAGTLYLFISRWNIFRDALYIMAFIGCFITLILIIAIHRTRFPYIVDGIPVHPTQIPPVQFSSTNFFYVFRASWFLASCVTSLWVASVMYEYWTLIDVFIGATSGPLHNFLVNFDIKFVPSVCCGTILVCWPIFHLALEICIFFIFVIPYYIFRNLCKQGIEFMRYPDRIHLDSLPGFVRIDMFFTECNQAKRLGFSGPLWHYITGTTEGFLDCFGPQIPMNNGGVKIYPTGQQPMGVMSFNTGNATHMTPVPVRNSTFSIHENNNNNNNMLNNTVNTDRDFDGESTS